MNEYITQYELTSLAFADLIEQELHPEQYSEEANTDRKTHELAPHESLRCVCGKTYVTGELIQCHDCQCYLHKDCIECPPKRLSSFRCPFCRMQIDGIDPFKDLNTWIEEKDQEIKAIHKLFEDLNREEFKLNSEMQFTGRNQASGSIATMSRIAAEVTEKLNKLARN